jgi:GTP cyclohydrolase II
VTLKAIQPVASADFPTRWGRFRIYGFRAASASDAAPRVEEAVALVMGDIHSTSPLVRIHSQCLTGDVFHSLRCDCRQQLEMALSMIRDEGAGVLIYEQQEGRGIGLMAKLQAYELQDSGLDTVEAKERLGFNPEKVEALQSAGIEVIERVPCEVKPSPHAEEYLKTKKEKLGHLFSS